MSKKRKWSDDWRTWRKIDVAWPVGQIEDRVSPTLPDGGRLHWQRFPDGSYRIHKDQFDPALSPLHAAAHVSVETPIGFFVKLAALVIVIGIASKPKSI